MSLGTLVAVVEPAEAPTPAPPRREYPKARHTVSAYVAWVHDPDEADFKVVGDARLVFTCEGDERSACHNYPDDVESWGEDSARRIPHAECWIQGWFDNEAVEYEGQDATLWSTSISEAAMPPCSRGTTEISAVFTGDYVAWRWAVPSPLQQVAAAWGAETTAGRDR